MNVTNFLGDRPGRTGTNALVMFTIYGNPSDYPGKFVVRRFLIAANGEIRSDREPTAVVDTIVGARIALPDGLVRIHRHPSDDPAIVETWL